MFCMAFSKSCIETSNLTSYKRLVHFFDKEVVGKSFFIFLDLQSGHWRMNSLMYSHGIPCDYCPITHSFSLNYIAIAMFYRWPSLCTNRTTCPHSSNHGSLKYRLFFFQRRNSPRSWSCSAKFFHFFKITW